MRALAVLAALALAACAPAPEAQPGTERLFLTDTSLLFPAQDSIATGTFEMVELDREGRPVTGVLRVYVQHCPRRRCTPAPEAFDADLVMTCYPQNLPPALRAAHVYPGGHLKVHLYASGPALVVTHGEAPALRHLLRGSRTGRP